MHRTGKAVARSRRGRSHGWAAWARRFGLALVISSPRLIQTVADNLRIPVHHYVEVDFSGFRELVDAAGGVRLWVPEPVRDFISDKKNPGRGRSMTGLNIAEPGCVRLDGSTPLPTVPFKGRHGEDLLRLDPAAAATALAPFGTGLAAPAVQAPPPAASPLPSGKSGGGPGPGTPAPVTACPGR